MTETNQTETVADLEKRLAAAKAAEEKARTEKAARLEIEKRAKANERAIEVANEISSKISGAVVRINNSGSPYLEVDGENPGLTFYKAFGGLDGFEIRKSRPNARTFKRLKSGNFNIEAIVQCVEVDVSERKRRQAEKNIYEKNSETIKEIFDRNKQEFWTSVSSTSSEDAPVNVRFDQRLTAEKAEKIIIAINSIMNEP